MVVAKKQLKERSICVYLPSVEMANRWRALAERSGRTISKFVAEHVENLLEQKEEGSSYKSRAELIKQLGDKDEEITRLKEESRLMKQLAERFDKELRRYWMQPFMEKEFEAK